MQEVNCPLLKSRFDRFNRGIVVKLLLVTVAFALVGCASIIRPNYTQELSELRAGQYQLDPEHVYVHFKIDHLGLSKVVGRFNQLSASLDFDPESLEELQLDGIVDLTSVDLNNPGLEDQLQGAQWFDTKRYPEATFTTQSVQIQTSNAFLLKGDLTIKGITKPITLQAVFNGGADNLLTGKYTLGFTATTSFSRSDYGIDAFAALVGDRVEIEIHAEFQRNNP